jgi:hypothetical protein
MVKKISIDLKRTMVVGRGDGIAGLDPIDPIPLLITHPAAEKQDIDHNVGAGVMARL